MAKLFYGMEESSVADFEKACLNAKLVQEKLLTQILLKNNTCDYLQKYGAPLDLESFKREVPVISYDHILQDIQKIADGSTRPILCTEPVIQFLVTSGTSSGNHKLIPKTLGSGSFSFRGTSLAYTRKIFPLESTTPLMMSLDYCMDQYNTKSGLVISTATSSYYRSEAYKQSSINRTSPSELVVAGSDWRQTTYCHLLCGLLRRHSVEVINSSFAYMLCEALRLLESEWKSICHDISTGSLNSSKITDENLRDIVQKVLQQEEKNSVTLSQEIYNICTKGTWDGIIRLLWPRVKYVSTIVTGTMQSHIPTLRKYAGDLPLVGHDYISSEGYFGVNINPLAPPEKVVFTLIPQSAFFEFTPVQGDEESIVGIEGVELGKQYELVVTTSQGLYRYKVGDVVKVVDFLHETPQVAFGYRKTAMLSINAEKVDEQELQQAVLNTAAHAPGMEIANFTSYAEFESDETPHYVIFWELKNNEGYVQHELLKDCCDKLDKSFNVAYLIGRVAKTIGPLELVTVKEGTFEKLMDKAVQWGTSPGQYKTPRCVTTKGMLEMLKQGKVDSYRSALDVSSSLVEAWKPGFPEEVST